MNNQPIEQVRLGTIRAAIWENQGQNGTRYTATLSRLYRDKDQWKSSHTLGRDDLLLGAKVLDLAHSRIMTLQKQAEPQAPEVPEDQSPRQAA